MSQEENYGRKAVAWLPKIQIKGSLLPVLKVFDSGNELQYAIRLREFSFTPKVFAEGKYKIVLTIPETGYERVIGRLRATREQGKVIVVSL